MSIYVKETNDITTVVNSIPVYVLEERSCSPRSESDSTYQWRYRKWNNGSIEFWRIGGNIDTFQTSHQSANGVFYSDESNWYPLDFTNYCKVIEIYQVTGSIDRKNNDGLPNLSIINCSIYNGTPLIKFIITANKNGTYRVSTNFYIQARWK